MRFWSLVIACLISLSCISVSKGAIYSGTLSYSPQTSLAPVECGLNVTGGAWADCLITMDWMVSDEDYRYPGLWKYTYVFGHDGKKGAISHLILETSPEMTDEEIVGFRGAKIESIGLQRVRAGNPTMPEDVYGMRLKPNARKQMTMAFTFYSALYPGWGDFYARDGRAGGGFNSAWNFGTLPTDAGFMPQDVDPKFIAATQGETFHVLAPGMSVPEPAAAVSLMALAALAMSRPTRRRGT